MMQVRRVKSSDLKLEHQILNVPNLVNFDVPVIVDKEMRVIFGDMMSLKLPELDVLVVDLPFEDTRLAMHSGGALVRAKLVGVGPV